MEKKIAYDNNHWGANKKIMDMINKREKSPQTNRLSEKGQKPGNFRFEFDSNLIQKMWEPKQPDKRGRDQVAAIDLELLFRNNERNRWGGGYFEFDEPRASTTTDRNQQESIESVSSTEDSERARPTANFTIVDLNDYDIAEKTIQ